MRIIITLLAGAMLLAMPGCRRAETDSALKTIVFVHGAWGGGWDYQQMEALLEAEGYRVYRPTLTGQGERVHLAGPEVDLETHILDIVNVLEFEDLHDIILVGHSYGGMVISGVAHRVPERIAFLVYADAFLPLDGESLFSLSTEESRNRFLEIAATQGDGWQIPPTWPDPGKDVPHPLATLRQAVTLGNPLADELPGTYILTRDPGADTDSFSRYAERARQRGWPVFELRTGHNLQRSMPEAYARLLMDIE